MDDDIKRLASETCLALIPQFYGNTLEATRIQQVHDAIIEPFVLAIMRLFRNAYIQTMDADALSELETKLNINPSGTIEQRRQIVIDTLCDAVSAFNDAELAARIERLSHGEDVRFRIDPQALTLEIWTDGGEQDGEFVAYDITQSLKPIIPQNLQLRAEMYAEEVAIDEHMTVGAVCAIAASIETETVNNDPSQYSSVYIVWLESAGSQKVNMVKAVKAVLGLGLKESKDLVDKAPVELTRYGNRTDAESTISALYAASNISDAIIYIVEE